MENVYDVHSDLESVGGEGSLDDFDDEVLDDLEPDRHVSGGGSSSGGGAGEGGDAGGGEGKDDATFELANVRRYIIGEEPLSQIVANSRKMFLLKVFFLRLMRNYTALLLLQKTSHYLVIDIKREDLYKPLFTFKRFLPVKVFTVVNLSIF